MKKTIVILITTLCVFFTRCNPSGTQLLFDGKNIKHWTATGHVSIQDGILTLTGTESQLVLNKGNYKNFILSVEALTTKGGKGAIWFHTDPELKKGYRVAINNDIDDTAWWKMTGSLLSVRNLTKSFVKENDWFTMDIRVNNNVITVTVNGEPVVEYVESTQPYRTPANAATLLSSGIFAIESNGEGDIQFKNISVTNLKPEDTVAGDAQQLEAIDEQKDEIIKLHQEDFPVHDYHVHLKGGLTKEMAAKQSRKTGINYTIAPNCGIGFPIQNDAQVMGFLDTMRTQPFILAMQAEGREWLTTFSPEVREQFDYVFTDALTFTDSKGRRTRLWIPEETWIENEQKYMDMLVETIIKVLQEPVDVYVNPCFLPAPMNKRYDEFWTEERMNKFVDALAKSGKALEINELYNIPSKAIILKAKAAGVKFTFGSNNVTPDVSKLDYSIRMKKECGLTANDMYKPKIKI